MIAKILRKPLRDVWKHEALDFTKWLQENIEVLGDVLELRLSNVDRERGCGDFCADLVAQDESGNAVIIENQLEKSDHDHLGKLITYLTALEAKLAVWIVAHPRPEHVRAIGPALHASPFDFGSCGGQWVGCGAVLGSLSRGALLPGRQLSRSSGAWRVIRQRLSHCRARGPTMAA